MRPQRLYKTDDGKYYFIIDGKRRYIRIPKNITEQELVKLNTKTILKLFGKRIRPRRKRKPIPKLEKPIINGELGRQLAITGVSNQPTASTNFVQQEKPILQISEIINQAKNREKAKTNFEKLIEQAGKSKTELFKGTKITENAKSITKPTAADTTSDNIEVSSAQKKSSASYDDVIIENLTSVKLMNDIMYNEKLGEYDIDGMSDEKSNYGYKKYLRRVINTFEDLSEDENKKLFLKYFENPQFIDYYRNTFEKWYTKFLSDEETSSGTSKSRSFTASESSEPSTISTSSESVSSTKPAPPSEPKPAYTKPSRSQYQDYLKKGASGLMPSLKDKPLTTAEKLASTPSYSGSTSGTESPASPMPVSVYEQAKAEYYASMSPADRAKEEAKAQMGFGNSDNGLYNDEIAKIIRKRVGKIIPVIPSDKVNTLLSYVVKGDKKFAAVVNTNPSSSNGSGLDGYRPGHWRAIYINNEDDFPTCEYFDPLAEGPPEKSLVAIMKKLAKKINPEKLSLYKQNNIRRQAKEKSTCGWHALQFIDDRWNGVPWSEATGYDNYIEKLQQPADDSNDGEKDVSKYIKKYNVYL